MRCSRQTSALQLKQDGISAAADTASIAITKMIAMLKKTPLSYGGHAQPLSFLVTETKYLTFAAS